MIDNNTDIQRPDQPLQNTEINNEQPIVNVPTIPDTPSFQHDVNASSIGDTAPIAMQANPATHIQNVLPMQLSTTDQLTAICNLLVQSGAIAHPASTSLSAPPSQNALQLSNTQQFQLSWDRDSVIQRATDDYINSLPKPLTLSDAELKNGLTNYINDAIAERNVIQGGTKVQTIQGLPNSSIASLILYYSPNKSVAA